MGNDEVKTLEFISFEQYLVRNDVIIDENKEIEFRKLSDYSIDDVHEYLSLLKEFHDKSKGYDIYFINKLENNIGKIFETYSIYVKRLNKQIKNIRENSPQDEFEKYLLENEEFLIGSSIKCIKSIGREEYLNIIRRSMKNIEVCIGSEGYYNLFKDEKIGLINSKKCNYDLLEVDCIKFINRLKKGQKGIDFRNIIEHFCIIEDLGKDSMNFILNMTMFPYESMRYVDKYRKTFKKGEPKAYVKGLEKAIEKDVITINTLGGVL